MMRHHRERIADCRQVVGPVPFHEQRDVIEQQFARAGRKLEPQFCESAVERGLRRHALFLSSGWKPRFKCASRSEIDAGVIPEMRAAWPMVSGRWRFSFCWTSAEDRKSVV